MRNILLSVVAAAGLVGCVGGIDMPSGDPNGSGSGSGSGSDNSPAAMAAKQAFDTGVYPIISAAGRCVACRCRKMASVSFTFFGAGSWRRCGGGSRAS